MSRRNGFSLVEALIVFAVLTGLWVVLLPALAGERIGTSGRLQCADNLRRLALAAIQYADDKRFFPHVRGFRELDGGMETPDTPRKVRLLVQTGYHDHPDEFVCPSSDDDAAPPAASGDSSRWSWRGAEASPGETLAATTPGLDPTLLETTELSYGWNRRTVSSNMKGIVVLAGDRASRKPDDGAARPPGLVGNHVGGLNLVHSDGYVAWRAFDAPEAVTIADVASGTPSSYTGFLSVEPPVEAPGVREPLRLHVTDARTFAWLAGPPAGLLVLLLAGVLAARRAEARPGAPEDPYPPLPRGGSR